MSGAKGLEVITESIRNVLIAERTFPPGSGPKKKRYVLDRVKPLLDVPSSPALSDLGDLTEILEIVGQLVSLVVRLLNMFGVFERSRREGDRLPKPKPEP